MAVKEEFESSGWKATAGSVLFKDRIADQTHPVLDKLREAGAVLHIQTTAPELFLLGVTWSDLLGTTRNPWNPEFTPGGSSGGSAAALAALLTSMSIPPSSATAFPMIAQQCAESPMSPAISTAFCPASFDS